MISRILRPAALILAVSLWPACKKEVKPEPPPSTAVKGYEFDDIPVARGFTLLRDQSCVIQNHSFRSGKLSYSGHLQMDILRDWYKKAMTAAPVPGWKQVPPPTGESGVGPYTLRFEKGTERCEIYIEAPKDETFVTLTLGLK